jgi:glutathione S-transferase
MKLYDSHQTPAGRVCHILAHELDLPLEVVYLDYTKNEQKQPAYLAVNPNGRVPSLVDGDLKLWETHAILTYMAQQRPEKGLVPQDARGRADMDRWLYWRSSHLHPAIMKVAYEVVVKPKYGLGEPVQAVVDQGWREIAEFAGILEGYLAKNEYLATGRVTVADIALAAGLFFRHAIKMDMAKYPNIDNWLQRMESRPSFKAVMEAKPYKS